MRLPARFSKNRDLGFHNLTLFLSASSFSRNLIIWCEYLYVGGVDSSSTHHDQASSGFPWIHPARRFDFAASRSLAVGPFVFFLAWGLHERVMQLVLGTQKEVGGGRFVLPSRSLSSLHGSGGPAWRCNANRASWGCEGGFLDPSSRLECLFPPQVPAASGICSWKTGNVSATMQWSQCWLHRLLPSAWFLCGLRVIHFSLFIQAVIEHSSTNKDFVNRHVSHVWCAPAFQR